MAPKPLNISQRCRLFSRTLLNLSENADPDTIRAALNGRCGHTEHTAQDLLDGPATTDPALNRLVAAARLLLSDAEDTRHVLPFLTADRRMPADRQLFQEVDTHQPHTDQLALAI